jgi:hypothetical protein
LMSVASAFMRKLTFTREQSIVPTLGIPLRSGFTTSE